jgi:Prohead core protein protease.
MVNRGEVVAYLIMEAASDPVKPQNVQVVDKNGLFYVNFDTVLQVFDRQNRNRREYRSAPMKASLSAPHISELIENRTWCGEAGHPMSDDVKRILTIDPNNVSHRINKFWYKGDNVLMGNIDTFDDNGPGSKFTRMILQGMEPAFSLRALAQLTKFQDGSAVMQSRCHIVCYDWVILPSHPEAYRDKSKPIQKIVKSFNSGTNIVSEGTLIPVNESQIKDFIKMESKNLRAVSNVYEVAMESMEVSEDFKNVIVREGNRTFVVKIEDRIKQDIRSFMSKL